MYDLIRNKGGFFFVRRNYLIIILEFLVFWDIIYNGDVCCILKYYC